jgi:hypothetical protein
MPSVLAGARGIVAALAATALFASVGRAQQNAPVRAVDTANRAQVIDLYRNYYLPSNNLAPDWTGNVVTGVAGTLSQAYLCATLQRINYYRAMSGVSSDITFGPSEDNECQQAALMMAGQGEISHSPSPDWKFYTPAAAQAAADSNNRLDSIGDEGPGAVDRFMADVESNNYYVGHRRWFIYPGEGIMGAGAVPSSDLSAGTAAIWILNLVPRPADAPLQTSWPPAGFVPAALVYDRWSFSYQNADFSATKVSVSKGGVPQAIHQEAPAYESSATDYTIVGDNTLVWEMPDNAVGLTDDETYAVHLANVRVNGVARSFDYTVTSIQPQFSAINLTALVPVAHRTGPVNGKFQLTRNGDLSPAQTVSYRVSGSGVPGQDYAALSGTVTFPPGAASVKIRVSPDTTPGLKGKKTVILTLEPSADYRLGNAVQATVTIKN